MNMCNLISLENMISLDFATTLRFYIWNLFLLIYYSWMGLYMNIKLTSSNIGEITAILEMVL